MQKIRQVIPQEEYIIKVVLSNGHMILLDLNSKINTTRFNILKNEELFKKLTLKDDFIIWRNKEGDQVELSYTDILYLLQATEEGMSVNQQRRMYHHYTR